MKLSLKFREENHPLLRAKIPVTILGLPFLSGIVAGDSSDLSFSLRSNFSSGPSLSLSYHPTLSTPSSHFPPFSVSLKSGIGVFGSPHSSPLIFSANFSAISITPSFSLLIKPQFGNFSLFKSVDSVGSGPIRVGGLGLNGELENGLVSDLGNGAGSVKVGNFSLIKSGDSVGSGPGQVGGQGLNGETGNGSRLDLGNGEGKGHGSVKGSSKDGILSGIFVAARTSMPVAKRAVVNLRWGVNFPSDSGGSKSGLPVLVMNKISLERVDEEEKKRVDEEKKRKGEEAKAGDLELLKGMCGWMSKEVEGLQRENREMRQALEGLRLKPGHMSRVRGEGRESVGKQMVHSQGGDGVSGFEKWRSKKNGGGEENVHREMKVASNGVSELENELQKAIKAASS